MLYPVTPEALKTLALLNQKAPAKLVGPYWLLKSRGN
jgi:hypothetical protein